MKRYVREAGSEEVRRWLRARKTATSRLSEVEVASALMRRWREGAFDTRDRDRALLGLVRDLSAMTIVEIVPAVTARARALLERHLLRAGDALQLASCLLLRDNTPGGLSFAGFDERLNRAAEAEKLASPS